MHIYFNGQKMKINFNRSICRLNFSSIVLDEEGGDDVIVPGDNGLLSMDNFILLDFNNIQLIAKGE